MPDTQLATLAPRLAFHPLPRPAAAIGEDLLIRAMRETLQLAAALADQLVQHSQHQGTRSRSDEWRAIRAQLWGIQSIGVVRTYPVSRETREVVHAGD